MKQDLTELVFILDRSGSMGGLESDTIGGFNAMLAKQKAEPGEAMVTTVLFDDKYELLHDRIDLRAVSPITDKEYFVRGSTALLDAVGSTIQKIAGAQKRTAEDYRADKVMFVITTDGMENASREYSYEKVKSMVEREKEKYGWEFIFRGANIDAVETAERFGIDPDHSSIYHADHLGTALNWSSVGAAVSSHRTDLGVASNWKDELEEDFRKRKADRR
ncbi:MAG: VWA domain-containing protein [Synergistaceae bacterium]|nr:VWA domain-containing protein [Synergistaceae bacterium]